MKIKKLTAVFLSITLCLLCFTPAFAAFPEGATVYSVKILSGNGKILKNNEESKDNFYNPSYPAYQYHYIRAEPSDFNEIETIEIDVREYETVKDRVKYDAEGEDADWYWWENEAYITSTKVVKSILENGLNTKYTGAEFAGIVYPKYCLVAYLFVPSIEGQHFSHFEDQDGNRFDLSEPVTKDLILTPIYTTDEVVDTLFDKEVHSVTILPGEGSIQRFTDNSYYGDWRYKVDCDRILLSVLDGDKTLDNINKAFALQKYSDIESGSSFLYAGKKYVLEALEANDPIQAIINFTEVYVTGLENQFFTEHPNMTQMVSNIVDDDGNQIYGVRNSSISFDFILTQWMDTYGEGYTSREVFEDTVYKAAHYDSMNDAEKAEAIEQMKNVIEAFSAAWAEYLLAEYANLDEPTRLITIKLRNGSRSCGFIYSPEDTFPDPAWCFLPPSDNYVFSHFEDQDGNVFTVGVDEVTKDLILTPVYYNRLDPRLEDNIEGKIFVDTEDNSSEEFNVSVIRNHKNTLAEIFNKGDYEGTEYEYLNDKNSYLFNEADWVIDDNGMITDYTGELVNMLGIPDKVNGITVIGVATNTFSSLYNRFVDNFTGPYSSEAPVDYFKRSVALWIPKTVQKFSEGLNTPSEVSEYKEMVLDSVREELTVQNKSEDEIQSCLSYYENALDVTIESTGSNNCTPLAYLPLSYVVVEDENPNYSSLGGSLYDKEFATLLHLSCALRLDEFRYSVNRDGYLGLEIPKSVTSISAFATYSAVYENYGTTAPLHAYGQTDFDWYSAYLSLKVFSPDDYLDELCQGKFGKSYSEIEELIASFNNPPAEVEQSFDETMSIAFLAAQEAGLMDENGNPLVSDDELVPFVLSYYASWLDSYPEYRFNEFAMMISTFVEGIFDPATNEQLVSDDELFAWQTTYIETYSNGAVTCDSNGELIVNLTAEERAEVDKIIAQNAAAAQLYEIEDFKELFAVSYSILTFILFTNQENVEAAKAPFEQMLALFSPGASQSSINESWESFYDYVQATTDYEGYINRYGTASESNPMATTFIPDDSYVYIAYLTNVPNRYVKPNIVELEPADQNKREGTIYLRLKRGGVDIVTYDENDNSVFIEATYSILDADDNIVGTITTHKDGTAVQVSDLTYGSYSVIQTSIEDGYYPNTSVKQFEITEDGDLIHLSFSNIKIQTLYSVKIPKTVILSGRNGLGICTISVIGKLQNNQSVIVRPINNTFNLFEQNASVDIKAPIAATVTQTKSVWTSSDLSEDTWSSANVTISAPITAGAWKGVLGIEIVLSVN